MEDRTVMGYSDCLKDFRSIDVGIMRPPGFLKNHLSDSESKFNCVGRSSGWKELTGCPLCGSENYTVEFTKFGIDIVACDTCTLRYSKQIPSDIKEVYSTDDYAKTLENNYMKNYEYRQKRFGTERMALIQQFVPDKKKFRLLDLGCGSGWFLDYVRQQGCDVAGQELGKKVAEWTHHRLGVPILNCPLSDIPDEENFDVITMFDLIEHVEDPIRFVLDAKKHLRHDGILVLFTPHFDSLAMRVMKERSSLVTPSEHLTFFTKRSVEKLSQITGMDLCYCRTFGIDLGDLKSFFEEQGMKDTAEACLKLYDLIQPIVDAAFCGNHMRFILRKIA